MATQSAGDIHLTSADGHRPMAFHAAASDPTGAGVVVVHARLGLLPFYKTLVQRLADVGHDAIAVDLYGRTAGVITRDDDFEFGDHYARLTHQDARPEIDADIGAALDFLRSSTGGESTSLFTLGFCFGGSISWWHSALDQRLSGCIGLYGGPRHVREQVPHMQAPLLLLHAGADQFISDDERSQFERDLTNANISFESRTYPGAPHSFFDRHHQEHSEAVDDAWNTMTNFISRHTT